MSGHKKDMNRVGGKVLGWRRRRNMFDRPPAQSLLGDEITQQLNVIYAEHKETEEDAAWRRACNGALCRLTKGEVWQEMRRSFPSGLEPE